MSNGKIKRTVRLSQAISPFGVGAIYDVLGESLVACDITYWKNHHSGILKAERLAANLGVKEFRVPPTAPLEVQPHVTSHPILYYRFPRWLFCSSCRRMEFWQTRSTTHSKPCCSHCGTRPALVPMRFITICENGHMSDVHWDVWAHSHATTQNQKQCRSKNLRFDANPGMGGSLSALTVTCLDCKATRSLEGIASKDSLARLPIQCSGKQPWQSSQKRETCGKVPQVVQRGASNVYFPVVKSAIDIPPDSDYDVFGDTSLKIVNHNMYSAVRTAPQAYWASDVKQTIAEDVGCTIEDVERCLARDSEQSTMGTSSVRSSRANIQDLESAEWQALLTRRTAFDPRDNFITRHVALFPPEVHITGQAGLATLVESVVIASRLREVRALSGFSRYRPGTRTEDDSDTGRLLRPDLGFGLDWLPAIEVYGEGIFLALNERALQRWEQGTNVIERATLLEVRRKSSFYSTFMPEATPRFLLLHTLAHLLIRQLSFECGYSATSLRERIYCKSAVGGDPMAGVLIYTAAGDGEGTLGGLARQGEPPRLARTIAAALQAAAWCSADPICIESNGQGIGGLNLGACHACSLVSETSCTFSNLLLDRAMLVGGLNGVEGFFAEFIDSIAQELAEGSSEL